jgi:tetratricopeptide (TPR) repeat protein
VSYLLKRKVTFGLVLVAASWRLISWSQDDPRQAAIALEQQGKTTEAEAAWSALAKAYPTNAEPFAHLGLLEARQEHYTEAVAAYRKAMALDPAMPRLRFNLGLAYFKAGAYREALQEFKPLLKTEQADSDEAQRLAILIGMSHYGLAEFVAADPYLKQASDRDARNLPLLLTLAHSCLLSNQYQCVLDAFHRIMSLNRRVCRSPYADGRSAGRDEGYKRRHPRTSRRCPGQSKGTERALRPGVPVVDARSHGGGCSRVSGRAQ